MFPVCSYPVFIYASEKASHITSSEEDKIIFMSKVINVSNAVEDDCLQAMKIVPHHANGFFDCLISGHQLQRVNPSREAISILSIQKIYVCPYCSL